jgi:hypothetical protein
MKKLTLALAAVTLLAISSGAFAQPVDNVNPVRHPNLAAAQRLSTQAFQKLTASQQANEFDEGGHAAKAKELLEQVNREIGAAAAFDNAHGRP